MPRACTASLVFPVLGLLLVLLLGSGPGFAPSPGFLYWFGAAALLQVVAAALLYRPSPASWKRGWILLWISCVGYMGGYADIYVQRSVVATDREDVWYLLSEPAKLARLDAEVRRLEVAAGDVAARAHARAKRDELADKRKTLAAKTRRLEDRFPGRPLDETLRAELAPQEEGFARLELVFAVLFVAAFFSIAAFVTHVAQDVYRVRDPDLEDPLAFKAEYGL